MNVTVKTTVEPTSQEPSWNIASPLSGWDFAEVVTSPSPSLAPINGLPVPVQETVVVRDLLAILQGFSRDYIRALPLDPENTNVRTFSLDISMDASLKHYVQELLPVASLYSRVARFVDGSMAYGCGVTVHAFTYAVRNFLLEYRRFLCEREDLYRDGQLTIQRLYHHVLPLVPAFETLSGVIDTMVGGAHRGGSLLTVLYEKLFRFPRSKETEQLLFEVTKAAAAPFCAMLCQWMHEGSFDDPYSEFLITIAKQKRMKDVAKRINSYVYWENRYRLNLQMVPKFLEPFTDKILRSGKYLNIIQQCGHRPLPNEDIRKLDFVMDTRYYEIEIEKAYIFASGTLLRLMIESEDLMTKLRSVKHFFLLDQDDFIPEFLDFALDDLKLPVNRINKAAIYAMFEDALRNSILNVDPYKSLMKPTFQKIDPMKVVDKSGDLTREGSSSSSSSDPSREFIGLKAFTMDCDVRFPLCLIINDEAKVYYQLLFQILFRLKVIEWNLGRIWTNCNSLNRPLAVRCCSPFAHQMLEFIKSLQHYFSAEVIDPYWHQMMTKIKLAKTFDEVFEEHNEFIASCSKDCMLTNGETLKMLYNLLDLCSKYCTHFQDPVFLGSSTLPDSVEAMKEKFTERMVNLLENMSDLRQNRESEYKLVGAIHRLDYNDYYNKRLIERVRERSRSRSSSTPGFSTLSSVSTASTGTAISRN